MAALTEHQFELDGRPFGLGLDVAVEAEGFDPGTAEWTVQDAKNPVGDGLMFGRDSLSGPTWGFDLFVDGDSTTDALGKLSPIADTWRNEARRRTPGAFSTLRYCVGGRTRRVYGRPRAFSAPPSNLILNGYIPITADFVCVDHLHHEDVENTVTVSVLPPTTGGILAPLVGPIRTLQDPGPRQGSLDVGGDQSAPAIITINGPISAPWVSSTGWRLEFDSSFSLAYDATLTIDTRSWVSTITRGDGASMAGRLTRQSSLLRDVRLAPGSRELLFGGIDATATATCTVRWRNVWSSL